MGIIDIDNKYVAHSYGRYPVCITYGKGSVVYDENNKKYIDKLGDVMYYNGIAK